ncbi:type IV toxin-antitoxin system AbiEi family antitoxin domain-containing protein [Chromobacterium haemolyticum]|uniref:type IV toxin-antitoxin system AbiEi family antitoxin domain-containing protein n=1 Tax=Chromobacterium TaxID=535 RepID=UPI004056210B
MIKQTVQHLMKAAPRGQPLDAKLLKDLGITIPLANHLVTEGWLMRLSAGAYLLTGDTPTQDGTIAFLGRKIGGLHVGGKTALAWSGVFHNIAFRQKIVLWGCSSYAFPSWIGGAILYSYQTTRLFNNDMPNDFQLRPIPNRSPLVLVSAPERALLELVSEIGKGQSYEEAENIVFLLRNLRKPVLHALLSHCTRIKVLRLVSRLSLSAGYSWSDDLPDLVQKLIHEKQRKIVRGAAPREGRC